LTFLSSDHVVVWVIQSSGNMGAENISANASVCGMLLDGDLPMKKSHKSTRGTVRPIEKMLYASA
jgi:hypothetical protein